MDGFKSHPLHNVGFHIFSGAFTITRAGGSLQQKAGIYKTVVDIQMKYPAKAFQDKEIKLQKSRRAVRNQYDDFMTFFGADLKTPICTWNDLRPKILFWSISRVNRSRTSAFEGGKAIPG